MSDTTPSGSFQARQWVDRSKQFCASRDGAHYMQEHIQEALDVWPPYARCGVDRPYSPSDVWAAVRQWALILVADCSDRWQGMQYEQPADSEAHRNVNNFSIISDCLEECRLRLSPIICTLMGFAVRETISKLTSAIQLYRHAMRGVHEEEVRRLARDAMGLNDASDADDDQGGDDGDLSKGRMSERGDEGWGKVVVEFPPKPWSYAHSFVQIKYSEGKITDSLHCRLAHFEKYKKLIDIHGARKDQYGCRPSMEESVYVMLKRYDSIIYTRNSREKGGNMHAAAPERVFHYLSSQAGVKTEGFASPNNCFFSRYFSAFPDTDWPFGSLGSLFDVDHEDDCSGAIEVGPPYTEEVLEMTITKMEEILVSTTKPLTLFLFVPDWHDCIGIDRMRNSRFTKAEVLGPGSDHLYVSGVQHLSIPDATRYYSPPHGTLCFILQNGDGCGTFPITQHLIDSLRGRMQDRDLAVSAPPQRRFSDSRCDHGQAGQNKRFSHRDNLDRGDWTVRGERRGGDKAVSGARWRALQLAPQAEQSQTSCYGGGGKRNGGCSDGLPGGNWRDRPPRELSTGRVAAPPAKPRTMSDTRTVGEARRDSPERWGRSVGGPNSSGCSHGHRVQRGGGGEGERGERSGSNYRSHIGAGEDDTGRVRADRVSSHSSHWSGVGGAGWSGDARRGGDVGKDRCSTGAESHRSPHSSRGTSVSHRVLPKNPNLTHPPRNALDRRYGHDVRVGGHSAPHAPSAAPYRAARGGNTPSSASASHDQQQRQAIAKGPPPHPTDTHHPPHPHQQRSTYGEGDRQSWSNQKRYDGGRGGNGGGGGEDRGHLADSSNNWRER
eukprot:GHVN01013430.1.p1 GENE.GHVN01013430.1~~GHVN01013430.1.p1  ORF type:complete len:833 (-),score=148.41 GHVN01013430.1:609-3107(-)